jgi:hypothetical protein
MVHPGLPKARILPTKSAGRRTTGRTGITARTSTPDPRLARGSGPGFGPGGWSRGVAGPSALYIDWAYGNEEVATHCDPYVADA